MGADHEFVLAALQCKDLIRSELRPLPELTFSDFVSWIFSKLLVTTGHIETVEMAPHPAIHALLSVVVSPNLYVNYSKAQIQLRLQIYERLFPIVQGCDCRAFETDRRVRDLVEDLLQRSSSFSPSELICCFRYKPQLHQSICPPTSRDESGRKSILTRFEQMLFISVLFSIHTIRKNLFAGSKKKRLLFKTSYFSQRNIRGVKTAVGPVAERIAFALHKVTKSWDNFAECLGFSGVEAMVLPYIVMRRPNYFFEVLQHRADGFLPKLQASRLDFHVRPTAIAEETFQNVTQRAHTCDQSLRRLSGLFLSDVFNVTHVPESFDMSSTLPSLAGFSYKLGNRKPAPRFLAILPAEDLSDIISTTRHSATRQRTEPTARTPSSSSRIFLCLDKDARGAKRYCDSDRVITTNKDRLVASENPNWSPPRGFPHFQYLPAHILGHLGTINNDTKFAVKYLYTPVDKWPPLYRKMLEQIDIETALTVEAAVCRVMVAVSTVRHPKAGRGVFALCTIQPEQIVCFYYGTLVFHNLAKRKTGRKTYGEGVLGVSVQRFIEYGLQVTTTGNRFSAVTETLNGKASICIVPAPFCVGGFINDASYVSGDEEFEDWKASRLANPRVQNCAIRSNAKRIDHPSKLVPPDVMVVEATQVICPGEELFMSYNKSDVVP